MAPADKRSLHLLQVLRGVAALMVVAHHSTAIPQAVFGLTARPQWMNGAAGVDIFFVISGFVMALSSRSLRGRSAPAVEFMKRRLERIAPLYWIFTTLKIALLLLVPAVAYHGLGSAWHVVSSYLFVPSSNSWGSALPVLAVGWTLNFEMLFYVLFAAALWLNLKPLKMLVPVLCIVAAFSLFLHNPSGLASWSDPIVLEFLFGMMLYEVYTRGKLLPEWVAWTASMAGFATIYFTNPPPDSMERPWTWGLAAMAIVAAGLSLEQRLGRKTPAWVLEIGDASYSIYLTHTFVVPVIEAVVKRQPLPALHEMRPILVLALPLCTAVGVGTYRVLEKPIIEYFRRRRESTSLTKAATA